MKTFSVAVKHKKQQKVTVEFDKEAFERFAALFGFFNPDFLESIKRSEHDYRKGNFKKLQSLKDFRTL